MLTRGLFVSALTKFYGTNSSGSIELAKQSDVESLKTSVSNGKSLIASAITDKGVSTAETATFQQMANNISVIKTTSSRTIALLSNLSVTTGSFANTATVTLVSGPDKVYYDKDEIPFHTAPTDDDDLYIGYGTRFGITSSLEIRYNVQYDATNDVFTFTQSQKHVTITANKIELIDGAYHFTLTIDLSKYASDSWGNRFYWDYDETDLSTKTLVAKITGDVVLSFNRGSANIPFDI